MWFLELIQWCYGTSIVLSIISFLLIVMKATHLWKGKHPDIKMPKTSLRDNLLTVLQLMLLILCPVINVVFIWLALFHLEETCDEVIRKMEIKHGVT